MRNSREEETEHGSRYDVTMGNGILLFLLKLNILLTLIFYFICFLAEYVPFTYIVVVFILNAFLKFLNHF
jgi:hypothetical protein